MSERANIRDVAALAGVAVKTVSRVLNSHPYVSAETRERVQKAMRELDFHPSVAARILSALPAASNAFTSSGVHQSASLPSSA